MKIEPQTCAVLSIVAGAVVATLTLPVYMVTAYALYAPIPAVVGALLIVRGLQNLGRGSSDAHGRSSHRH